VANGEIAKPGTPNPPPGGGSDEKNEAIGRTFADVVDRMLHSPLECLIFLTMLVALGCLGTLGCISFFHLFDVRPSEIQIGLQNTRVVLEHEDKKSHTDEYLVMVSPQGWQDSGVPVHSKDSVSFSAGGRISIDLYTIVTMATLRNRFENEWANKLGIKRDDPKELRVPEDYFTDAQKKALLLNRPWVGPEGFSLDTYKPGFESRRKRYLLPGSNAGGLIAAFYSGDQNPNRSNAFFVGRESQNNDVQQDGTIWFTVNDVQSLDPTDPYLFYNDNIGSFWVKMTVKHNER